MYIQYSSFLGSRRESKKKFNKQESNFLPAHVRKNKDKGRTYNAYRNIVLFLKRRHLNKGNYHRGYVQYI